MSTSAANYLVLTPDAFGGRGGIALYNRDVLTALASHEQVGRIVVLPRSVPDAVGAIPQGIDYRTRAAGGKLRYVLQFLRATSGARFDAVFCMHINLLSLARRVARARGIPLVLWIYGIDAWTPPARTSARRAVPAVDEVVSISRVTLSKFREWSEIPYERCAIMPNAIHLDAYGVGPAPAALVDRYDLRGRRVLLTLGRLSADEQYKGVDEVLDALPSLDDDVVYLVVGDGTDRARLEARAAASGLGDRVRFAGRIPEGEKADHYRLANAYVMPSQGEGFGFVFLEALACGIPVVASDLDGGREAVRKGMFGELVDPRDPDSVLRGIRAALGRPRGVVPDGFHYFAFPNFQERLHTWLDERLLGANA